MCLGQIVDASIGSFLTYMFGGRPKVPRDRPKWFTTSHTQPMTDFIKLRCGITGVDREADLAGGCHVAFAKNPWRDLQSKLTQKRGTVIPRLPFRFRSSPPRAPIRRPRRAPRLRPAAAHRCR